MIDLKAPPSSPALVPLVRDINRNFIELARLNRTVEAKLPPATQHQDKLYLVSDLNGGVGMVVFSNGTDWIRTDTGAAL